MGTVADNLTVVDNLLGTEVGLDNLMGTVVDQ